VVVISGSYIKALASPWMLAGMAALAAAGYGLGFVHGLEREQKQTVEFREQIAAAHAVHVVRAARDLQEAKAITERVTNAYGVSFDELARRLRVADEDRRRLRGMSAAAAAAGSVQATVADAGPGAERLAAAVDEAGDRCADVEARCAVTTHRCAWMMQWQLDQEAVGEEKAAD
jgi:hypothetical protein